jgi:hypothetical protein
MILGSSHSDGQLENSSSSLPNCGKCDIIDRYMQMNRSMFWILALSTAAAVLSVAAPSTMAASGWSTLESKSPEDGSSQIGGALVVGDAALVLRCREQNTEAAYSTKETYLGGDAVTVRTRINADEPIKQVWQPSANSFAVFAPKPEEFIRSLPDNGRVFIRAITPNGGNKDTNFVLAGVSEIREQIARSCHWSVLPDDATGSIDPTQKR